MNNNFSLQSLYSHFSITNNNSVSRNDQSSKRVKLNNSTSVLNQNHSIETATLIAQTGSKIISFLSHPRLAQELLIPFFTMKELHPICQINKAYHKIVYEDAIYTLFSYIAASQHSTGIKFFPKLDDRANFEFRVKMDARLKQVLLPNSLDPDYSKKLDKLQKRFVLPNKYNFQFKRIYSTPLIPTYRVIQLLISDNRILQEKYPFYLERSSDAFKKDLNNRGILYLAVYRDPSSIKFVPIELMKEIKEAVDAFKELKMMRYWGSRSNYSNLKDFFEKHPDLRKSKAFIQFFINNWDTDSAFYMDMLDDVFVQMLEPDVKEDRKIWFSLASHKNVTFKEAPAFITEDMEIVLKKIRSSDFSRISTQNVLGLIAPKLFEAIEVISALLEKKIQIHDIIPLIGNHEKSHQRDGSHQK